MKDVQGLPLTIRAVFIIGPDKKLKLSLNYPASVGRNMDEIMRCVDALQISAQKSVVRSNASCPLSSTATCPLQMQHSHALKVLAHAWTAPSAVSTNALHPPAQSAAIRVCQCIGFSVPPAPLLHSILTMCRCPSRAAQRQKSPTEASCRAPYYCSLIVCQ